MVVHGLPIAMAVRCPSWSALHFSGRRRPVQATSQTSLAARAAEESGVAAGVAVATGIALPFEGYRPPGRNRPSGGLERSSATSGASSSAGQRSGFSGVRLGHQDTRPEVRYSLLKGKDVPFT